MSSASHHGRVAPRRTGGGLRLDRWDLGFFAAVLVILVGSIVPLGALRQNLWNTPGVFFLGVGVVVPLVAAGLILSRGISGLDGPRVGSLTTEQFAHVASWLALAYFFSSFVTSLHPVFLIGLVGALGMVLTSPLRGVMARALASSAARRPRQAAGTSGAPAAGTTPAAESTSATGASTATGPAPTTGAGASSAAAAAASADSAPEEVTPAEQAGERASGAVVTPAAAAAREERGQPEPERTPDSQPGAAGATGAEADDELGQTRLRPRSTQEAEASATAAFGAPGTDLTDEPSLSSTPEPEPAEEPAAEPAAPRGTEPGGFEAFWFAVGSRREAVNPEDGTPAFTLEPGGWILALEDRGQEFLVQNTDGRTGVLRDLSDIERA